MKNVFCYVLGWLVAVYGGKRWIHVGFLLPCAGEPPKRARPQFYFRALLGMSTFGAFFYLFYLAWTHGLIQKRYTKRGACRENYWRNDRRVSRGSAGAAETQFGEDGRKLAAIPEPCANPPLARVGTGFAAENRPSRPMRLPAVRLAVETVESKSRQTNWLLCDGHCTFKRRRGSTTRLSCFFVRA